MTRFTSMIGASAILVAGGAIPATAADDEILVGAATSFSGWMAAFDVSPTHAAEIAADIRRYQALGVSHFVFDHTVQELRAVLANIERFASDVRPTLSRSASGRAATAARRPTAAKKKAAKRRA